MKKICILILNWNNWRDTIECIASLWDLSYGNYNMIVIDNGSTDGSPERIRSWIEGQLGRGDKVMEFVIYDWNVAGDKPSLLVKGSSHIGPQSIILIRIEKNLGYAGGNNVGIRYALRLGADFIWILNNDTKVTSFCLDHLVNCAMKKPEVGVWGSTLVNYGDGTVQCAGGAVYEPLIMRSRYVLNGVSVHDAINFSGYIRLDYVAGASMFVRSEVFRSVGLLSEDYFLYFEELDFIRRCKKAGYLIDWCRACIVFHKEGKSLGSSKELKKRSERSEFHSNLSALKFTLKHHRFLLPIAFVLRFVLKVMHFGVAREFRLVIPLCRAYGQFIKACLLSLQRRCLGDGVE